MRSRLLLAAAGLALAAYGVIRLLGDVSAAQPIWLMIWLAGAVIVHDGVIAPLTVGLGALVARVLPRRGRRFVQFGLVWIGLITAVAVPLIVRRGSQPSVKALDDQDYVGHLGLLAVVATLVVSGAYLVDVMRTRRSTRARSAKTRPSTRQDSTTE